MQHLQQPDLAIEILSREDEPGDTLARIGDYLRSGTPTVWIVDPYKRQLFIADYTGVRDVPELIAETDLVGRVDFKELFARLDEPAE